jgi:hypothetical protein
VTLKIPDSRIAAGAGVTIDAPPPPGRFSDLANRTSVTADSKTRAQLIRIRLEVSVYCGDCGYDVPMGQSFCGNCGSRVALPTNRPIRCPDCGLENPPSSIRCDCGHNFTVDHDVAHPPAKVQKATISDDRRQGHINRSKSLIMAGYVCGLIALVFLPPGFAFAGIVIGIVNLTKGRLGHGIAQIAVATTCGIVGMYLGAYTWNHGARPTPVSPSGTSVSPEVMVTYEVRGTADRASLTYSNPSGGMEQQTQSIPWHMRSKMRRGSVVYLSAQNETDFGILRARIYANGKILQEAQSTSSYGIASVGGTVDPDDRVFNAMTPKQHLQEAIRLSADNWNEAASHLEAISTTAPEHAQTQAVLGQIGDAYKRSLQVA